MCYFDRANVLQTSTLIEGAEAMKLVDGLNSAKPGRNADLSETSCLREGEPAPPEAVLIVHGDDDYAQIEMTFSACTNRGLSNGQSEAQLTMTLLRAHSAAVRVRVEAGAGAGEQLLQAEAGIADVEAELATAQSDEQSARTALRALVGSDLALRAPLVMETPEIVAELPEVRMARAWRKQASELATLGDLEWIPRLIVGASAGYANPPPSADPGYYAVGAAIAIPLTSALRGGSVRHADVALSQARALEAESVLRDLAVRVAEMDGAIVGLEAALPAAERSREVADRALAAVAVRAQVGAVPQLDVEASRAVLRRAEMRVWLLRLRIDGLRSRRAYLTTAGRA